MTLVNLIGSAALVGAAAGSVFGHLVIAGLRLRRRIKTGLVSALTE